MNVEHLALEGVLLLHARVFPDARGLVYESWRDGAYRELGMPPFVQDTVSRSARHVLRGLHFQRRHPQGKLLTVLAGEILDVVADVRPVSPTFGQHVAVVLRGGSGDQLWVPAGYAHGFVVRSAEADVHYKLTDVYHADDQGGVRWDDPTLAVPWGVEAPLLSDKDAALPWLADLGPEALPA
ncbi:MAG: dTDP-4-dehydrorhamnose 3,5-epimerase [Alphaproteobacteria bacterium]|nr:dTDP-4-dehydrorhamnose 3,5-epimerase [Alphaproteobacteria bacterium]